MTKKIRVLIVDDSELIRVFLNEILSSDSAIEVVGLADDPYDARDKIKLLAPDVITLDIEMPRMDGITFLSNIMRLRPMPVVMISTLTQKGADATMQARELGAVDFVSKPTIDVQKKLPQLSAEIIAKVKNAAKANLVALEHSVNPPYAHEPEAVLPGAVLGKRIKLIAIGASTGGTEATKEVLSGLPENMPPIVVVQHMPAGFTGSYAQRLDKLIKLSVEEFCGPSQVLEQNHVYVANGDLHMRIQQRAGVLKAFAEDSEPVNRHKPSVDLLFDSVAESCGEAAIGIILTGMGIDGASGLGKMRASGAHTAAQDEESSVVWGMPRVAVQQGAAKEVLALKDISHYLVKQSYRNS